MKRVRENFIQKIEEVVSLQNKSVLEVGCGSGNYSRQIERLCDSLIGIDPNKESILQAKEKGSIKTDYRVGSATHLNFDEDSFDIVVFTLSFHHVPASDMDKALKEAVRVAKPEGYIIFLEPTKKGSFFEAEILFSACDGDENLEKDMAYKKIKNCSDVHMVKEIEDMTEFTFESQEDFISSLNPKKNISKISDFLRKHDMNLDAQRRIMVCKPI